MTRFRLNFAKTLIILAALAISWLLNGCTTFDKAFRKYASNHVDTTYQTVTLTVPRDSVVKVFKTDTTHLIERVRQGRATVTIIREPTNTTVIANCDSAQTKTKVLVKTVRQIWGVDPKFEKSADLWRTIAFILIAVLGGGILMYIFTHHYQLSIAKR